MRKLFQFLGVIFWHDWLFTLWVCLGIALPLWLWLAYKPFKATLGISSDSFSIFCGSVATLSGVLLGLVIAAIAFITQYSISSLHNNRDIVLREGRWLQSWLSSNKFQNEAVLEKLEEICGICLAAPNITREERESDELESTISSTLESLENFIKECETKTDILDKKFDELEAKNTPEDDESFLNLKEEEQHIEEELSILKDLLSHIFTMCVSLTRIEASILSAGLVRQMAKLASIVGFILILALVFLVLSGIESSGAELLSNYTRLVLAIYLVWAFSPSILMIFRVLSIQLRIISIEVGKKI